MIAVVQDTSASNTLLCPFLPRGFKSDPLWLGAYQQQPNIMRLLVNAGASPYEVCNLGYCTGYDFRLTIFAMCEKHLPTRTVLENPSIISQKFPIPLHIAIKIFGKGSEWMVEFLNATFRWDAAVVVLL